MSIPTLPRPPFALDPLVDAPLVGPSTFAIVPSDGSNDGCSAWRIWQPMAFLRLHGYDCGWEFRHQLDFRAKVLAGVHDLHLLCRVGAMGWERRLMKTWLAHMHDAGKTVVYETDDDLFTPFSSDQLHRRAPDAPPWAQLEAERAACVWVLQRVDGVTVTTQHLATTVRRFTDAPVEVVPNAIDAGWFAQVQAGVQRTVPPPTIGWAGGARPDADFEAMAQAWGRVARRYPQVRFVVQGAQPEPIARHVPADRLVSLPWMPVAAYPQGLVNIDIGCCPLEDRAFNRCKTPIKAWEYAVSGAAVVASPTVYQRCVTHGTSGLLASTADDWYAALCWLVEDTHVRQGMADRLRQDVLRTWSLKANYWRWPMAWNRLWTEAGHGRG